MLFEKAECLASTYKSGSLRDKLPKWTMVYVCGGQNVREEKRKKEKGNVWMKERQRIRNHNLKILPQYFHNNF